MATPHISAEKKDIAPIVIMPGDPLRAKHIVENYFDDYEPINAVRNMYGYTGHYKGKRMTVFASGMGMPSIGIYGYELYNFYDVETIVRVGSCGGFKEDIKLLDVILVDKAYTNSTFAKMFSYFDEKEIEADHDLNEHIAEIAKHKNMKLHRGRVITSDIFDVYIDNEIFFSHYPSNLDYLGAEMEAFGLLFLAKLLNKKASCLLTVVDSHYDKTVITSEERQNSLNKMIELALDSLV